MRASLLDGIDEDEDSASVDALPPVEDAVGNDVAKKKAAGGIKDLLKGAPRDLFVVVVVVLLESLAYFAMTNMFILMLESEYGMNDTEASTVYASFGLAISVYAILFGWIVDHLLVRKSLLIHVGLGFVSKVAMGFMASRATLWIVLMGPLSFSLSMGGTAMLVAIRRYTTINTLTVAVSLRYVAMNIGSLISEPLTDAVRVKLVPAFANKGIGGYSLFIGITAILHLINFALVFLFVRDVCVVNEDDDRHIIGAELHGRRRGTNDGSHIRAVSTRWQVSAIVWEPTPGTLRNRWREGGCRAVPMWLRDGWRSAKAQANKKLLGYVLLSFGVLGAKSVFRYLDSLYPLWMTRAPFPVAHPEDVPFNSFIMINPLIVIVFTTAVASFIERRGWHPYWVILLGTLIAGLAPFWMMIIQYWAVVLFITQLSLGEIIWTPMMQAYSCWFTREGKEGIFFALSTIPLFGAKAIAGVLSGALMSAHCPVASHDNTTTAMLSNLTTIVGNFTRPPLDTPACSPIVWFLVGAFAISSPALVLLFKHFIKIENPATAAPTLSPDDFMDLPLEQL